MGNKSQQRSVIVGLFDATSRHKLVQMLILSIVMHFNNAPAGLKVSSLHLLNLLNSLVTLNIQQRISPIIHRRNYEVLCFMEYVYVFTIDVNKIS